MNVCANQESDRFSPRKLNEIMTIRYRNASQRQQFEASEDLLLKQKVQLQLVHLHVEKRQQERLKQAAARKLQKLAS
jgi:hypothetical protein